jgi:hypothetical protein
VDAGSTAGVFEPGDLSLEDALPEAQCLGGLVEAGVLGGHEHLRDGLNPGAEQIADLGR